MIDCLIDGWMLLMIDVNSSKSLISSPLPPPSRRRPSVSGGLHQGPEVLQVRGQRPAVRGRGHGRPEPPESPEAPHHRQRMKPLFSPPLPPPFLPPAALLYLSLINNGRLCPPRRRRLTGQHVLKLLPFPSADGESGEAGNCFPAHRKLKNSC